MQSSQNINSNKNNFDEFPLYDELTKKVMDKQNPIMSDVWRESMATLFNNLISYLTQGGILLPQLTTLQRDNLINIQNGQMIYNTDLGSAQYFKAGTWTSF
jgi:hypothetical protein